MKQFKKSPKEIEDYHKQVIRGSRNHVIKKILKATQETVAIKEIGKFDTRDEETERQFWSEVAINDYLKDCKYILKFRGVIELGGIRHMIYEWSNHGDLQTYLRVHPNLPWSFKIKVAWEISSALSHCHEMEILHHDVRAHNVMLGVNCIVQLTNFETARPQSGGKSWPLKDKDEILRWTAPEKDSSETRYTSECDVFSFGVLLWEIVSQTRPFDKIKDGTEVFEKILIGERPNINMYMKDGHQISVASDNYFKIMTEAWSQEANHRPSMSSICERLRNIFHTNINEDEIEYTENLSKENDITVLDPLTQTTTSENILTSNENNVKSKEEFLLEKARQYHDAKDYFNAWSIYDNLLKSDKGNAEVKFMVGSYLVHGPPYCQNNDIDKAENYLREAADDGYAKAQYLYYQLLFNKAGKYLKLAANQNYTEALYDHGYHLYKGTFERRDPAKGAESLIAAHYQLHNNALGKLNELEKRHAKEKKMKKE
ncbi:kinase-like protein [Gigaspora margarita]|uniref:Kinase-like protein n=3 Tax=Gigaspora margarita TaxID=4874 RepID=A0A8H4ENY9_GIGMA|nr:kinase-like protein [Gigaspora margarita]